MEDRALIPRLASVAIGLGTSLGDPAVLTLATLAIARVPGVKLVASSRVVFSAPAGGVAAQPFHNAVLRVTTSRDLDAVLGELQALERRLGRRPTRSWADRRLDLDVLVWGDHIVVGRRVQVPHPRIAARDFVLGPLAEVWPDCRDPWTGRPYRELPRRALPVVGVLPRPAP